MGEALFPFHQSIIKDFVSIMQWCRLKKICRILLSMLIFPYVRLMVCLCSSAVHLTNGDEVGFIVCTTGVPVYCESA